MHLFFFLWCRTATERPFHWIISARFHIRHSSRYFAHTLTLCPWPLSQSHQWAERALPDEKDRLLNICLTWCNASSFCVEDWECWASTASTRWNVRKMMIFFCFCFSKYFHPDIGIIPSEKSFQPFPMRVITGEEINFVLCAVRRSDADLFHVPLKWRPHSLLRSLR